MFAPAPSGEVSLEHVYVVAVAFVWYTLAVFSIVSLVLTPLYRTLGWQA